MIGNTHRRPRHNRSNAGRVRRLAGLALLFILFGYCWGDASAQIYKWVDHDGNVHYSDKPPEGAGEGRAEVNTVDAPAETRDLDSRRRLEEIVEQAERRIEARQAQADAKRAEKEAGLVKEHGCFEVRRRLAVLQEQHLPVYRDQEGRFRAQWQGDVYRGKREYLDDAARALEAERAKRDVLSSCGRLDDAEAQTMARRQWVRSELCAAAMAELALLEQPRVRASRQAIERKREDVQFFCKE